jgi:hypothetical protein
VEASLGPGLKGHRSRVERDTTRPHSRFPGEISYEVSLAELFNMDKVMSMASVVSG